MTEEDVAAFVAEKVTEALAAQREALAVLAANMNGAASHQVDIVAEGMEGLAKAVAVAVRLEAELQDARDVKFAVFGQDGEYIGTHHTSARTADLSMGDPWFRLAWRPEWDDIPIVIEEGMDWLTMPILPKLPNLFTIPDAETEIAGQIFAAFAASAVRA